MHIIVTYQVKKSPNCKESLRFYTSNKSKTMQLLSSDARNLTALNSAM
jgi:hypothetical protein